MKLNESYIRKVVRSVIKESVEEERPTLYTNTINKKDPTKRNHSPINRVKKYGVAKGIGGELYLHVNYVDRIPQHLYEPALQILRSNPQTKDFHFNVVIFPDKLDNAPVKYVKFVNCDEFDTKREPRRGEGYWVYIDTGQVKRMGSDNTIYHHKWCWVDDDYTGFNVDDSYNWSAQWLPKLEVSANGNSLSGWNAQLDKYGLPHDE